MNMRMVAMGFAGVMVAAGGACAFEPEGEIGFRDTTACPNCGGNGSNSAHANSSLIGELSLYGDANEAGITVQGVEDPLGTRYLLRTVGDELAAWDPQTSTNVALAADLVGWTIKLYRATSSEEIDIEILGYDDAIASLADDGPEISGYALAYHPESDPDALVSICPVSPGGGPEAISATIIRGELYDEASKEITADQDWITIACLGDAAAKAKLLGYGPNQHFPGRAVAATQSQRQATIRMITADYCGDGDSFTVDGAVLQWQNAAETVAPELAPEWGDVEALWDEDGAICLSNPRHAALAEVEAHCILPACTPQLQATVPHEWTTWRVD